MGMTSRRKGKRGEREFCREMRERGYGAYRSAQHAGIAERDDSADVITSLTTVRFEVKRTSRDVRLWHDEVQSWCRRAAEETPSDKRWCVAWRPDRGPWVFIFHRTVVSLSPHVEYPWNVQIGFDAMLTAFDANRRHVVENPGEWTL